MVRSGRLRNDGGGPLAHPLALRSLSVSLTARADGYIVMDERERRVAGRNAVTVHRFSRRLETSTMIRPTPAVDAIPATTPFVGPEQLMRETGRRELVRLRRERKRVRPVTESGRRDDRRARRAFRGTAIPSRSICATRSAHKHGCASAQIVVGAGIDDLMGFAVRAFVAPAATALTTRGTYPDRSCITSSVTAGRLRMRPVPRRRSGPISTHCCGIARRARHASSISRIRIIRAARFVSRDEIAAFLRRVAARRAAASRRSVCRFRGRRRAAAAGIFERSTDPTAHVFEGIRHGRERESATRSLRESNSQTFQKIRLHYGINRNAQIGALASLHDDAFRRTSSRETARAREEYYALARELGCGYIESRTNFVCIEHGERRARRRASWTSCSSAACGFASRARRRSTRYIRVSAGHRTDAPRVRRRAARASSRPRLS